MNEKKFHILLIEDNPGDARLIKELLLEVNSFDFELKWALTLSEGLDMLNPEDTDIVLLDLSLPDSHGMDTFSKVYHYAASVPVIVLSGFSDEMIAVQSVREGAQDYLVKGEVNGNLLVRAMIYAAERKQAGEALRLKDKALASSINAIAFTDLEGKITYINHSFLELWGYESDKDIIGKDAKDFWDMEDETIEKISSSATENKWIAEIKGTRKDGNLFDVQSSVSLVTDESGHPVCTMGSFLDVTQRKRDEEELKQYAQDLETAKDWQEENAARLAQIVEELDGARRRAEEATKTKSEFLANMSHEIRTPMNGIIGMTELALGTHLDDEQKEYMMAVKTSADLLLTIINDILDFSKIEAGKLDIESIQFDLRDAMDDTLQTLGFKAYEKELDLICHVHPDVPEILVGDPGRVRQIIINLVNNAIKFTHEGEVLVKVDVEEIKSSKVKLHFSVTDTGIGVPEEKQKLIFEAFTQADGSTTRKYGGTGLGLTICSKLVSMMGGSIWTQSPCIIEHEHAGGPGSTFHFTAEFGILKDKKMSSLQLPKDLQGARVMIVDDNRSTTTMLDELLGAAGFDTEIYHESSQVLEMLSDKDKNYKYALIDSKLKDIDAFRIVRQIQFTCSGVIPILMLSAEDQTAASTKCKEYGVGCYQTKPIKFKKLLKIMMSSAGISVAQMKAALEAGQTDTGTSLEKNVESLRGKLNILLAEDNPINQKLAISLLSKQEWHIKAVGDGAKAIEALAQDQYDVVLMDVQMPNMDGFAATQAIREQEKQTGKHQPIVAMTAHAMQGDREKCLSMGMDDYISKPMKAQELYKTVARVLDNFPAENVVSEPLDVAEPEKVSIPKLDLSRVMDALDGDQDLLKELISDFLVEIPKQLSELKESIEAGNSKQIERKAHSLKGAVANFGADDAYKLAYSLETLGREAKLDQVAPVYDDLEVILNQLSQFFKQPDWDKEISFN